ncbi:succinylglutamate desuccinylase/aspartoacylase family protein [Algoriphagus sp. D3-2-R+10]|uniref:succinylglutamate desuccinylase/aspartoacylase family protein n=1 Tax=Algoriphagus aurantiacus TaxID=3103948 RepID=UPI002B3C396B|nr:succinylglutamate desuccinylase/aspartoacylase family protein [Algoriphagus sp. D3-2-R+10]MEB2776282.1 succinylglutamate desuccinylase/aspartoacylase family protein [Algoriphagus sp. D3-2-R+10]
MKSKSEVLDKVNLTRVIGEYPAEPSNQTPGPYLLVSGGVHGNEPSGVLALQRVFRKLYKEKPKLKGKIVGVAGNIVALKKGVRLIDKDLNRVCTLENEKQLKTHKKLDFHEGSEFNELLAIVEKLENEAFNTEFHFMDLHTTSSSTAPYISVNRREESFAFAKQMPLPVVKGIEKYIPGHFDHYQTLKGHTGFTMEAGQHDDPKSVDYHEAAIWLILVKTGMLEESSTAYEHFYKLLESASPTNDNFKVTFRQDIGKGQVFKMDPGYSNFTEINKGQRLASLDGESILSDSKGRVFLPLYQSQGSDGFFIVKPA